MDLTALQFEAKVVSRNISSAETLSRKINVGKAIHHDFNIKPGTLFIRD